MPYFTWPSSYFCNEEAQCHRIVLSLTFELKEECVVEKKLRNVGSQYAPKYVATYRQVNVTPDQGPQQVTQEVIITLYEVRCLIT